MSDNPQKPPRYEWLIKGDAIPPWFWTGEDWVLFYSDEHKAIVADMMDRVSKMRGKT